MTRGHGCRQKYRPGENDTAAVGVQPTAGQAHEGEACENYGTPAAHETVDPSRRRACYRLRMHPCISIHPVCNSTSVPISPRPSEQSCQLSISYDCVPSISGNPDVIWLHRGDLHRWTNRRCILILVIIQFNSLMAALVRRRSSSQQQHVDFWQILASWPVSWRACRIIRQKTYEGSALAACRGERTCRTVEG